METWLTPTGDDDTGDNRDESGIGNPGFSLKGHDIGEEGREKRRRSTDGLVEGDGKVTEGDVAADDGATENDAKRRDLEELRARFEGLERNKLEEDNGDIAEDGAGRHVTHCEENGEFESIIGEEELVEEKNTDVGGIPEDDQGRDEEGLFLRRRRHFLPPIWFLLRRDRVLSDFEGENGRK